MDHLSGYQSFLQTTHDGFLLNFSRQSNQWQNENLWLTGWRASSPRVWCTASRSTRTTKRQLPVLGRLVLLDKEHVESKKILSPEGETTDYTTTFLE